MGKFKAGDIVARKSYGFDILFRVVDVKTNDDQDELTLKGLTYRIEADAPESDLILQTEHRIREYMQASGASTQKSRLASVKNKDRLLKKSIV